MQPVAVMGPAPGAMDGMKAMGMAAAKKEAKSPSGCFGAGPLGMLLPLILMFVVFYFFLIRPQQKKQKEHQAMLGALRKGDSVVTSGGIMGKITGLTDQYVVIEVQEKVRFRVLRSHVSGKHAGESRS